MNGINENDCEDMYSTQPVDEVDTEIYDEIKSQLGQYDKETFIQNLVEKYNDDPDQINEIRLSMYDYAKSTYEEFPSGYLTERRQRGKTGKTIGEKYATDVYYIFAFCEGIVSTAELQREVMSKHKMKYTSASLREFQIDDQNCDDAEKVSQGSLYSAIMESLHSELLPIQEQLSEMKSAFQGELRCKSNEIRSLRCENERLQLELNNCTAEKSRLADSEAQLKSEIRFLNQKIKSYDDEYDTRTQIMKELKKIQKTQNTPQKQNKQTEIKIQCEQKSAKQKSLYSTVVTGKSPDGAQLIDTDLDKSDESSHSTVFGNDTCERNVHPEIQQVAERNIEHSLQSVLEASKHQHTRSVSTPTVTSSCIQNIHTSVSDPKKKASILKTSNVGQNFDSENPCLLRATSLSRELAPNIICESQRAFTGYTFVRGKRSPSRRVVLANIKARDTTFERVKSDIIDWCKSKDVDIFGIFLLAHHSERKFPTFVIRANIAENDYSKTHESDFWPDTISVRDWIVRNEKYKDSTEHSDSS